MKNSPLPAVLLELIQLLAVALWLGTAAAPWFFSALRPLLWHSAPLLHQQQNAVTLFGLLLLGGQWLVRRRYRHKRQLFVAEGVRWLLTFGALLAAETAASPAFAQALSAIQVVLLSGVLLLSAWLNQGLQQEPAVLSDAQPAPRKKAR